MAVAWKHTWRTRLQKLTGAFSAIRARMYAGDGPWTLLFHKLHVSQDLESLISREELLP